MRQAAGNKVEGADGIMDQEEMCKDRREGKEREGFT